MTITTEHKLSPESLLCLEEYRKWQKHEKLAEKYRASYERSFARIPKEDANEMVRLTDPNEDE